MMRKKRFAGYRSAGPSLDNSPSSSRQNSTRSALSPRSRLRNGSEPASSALYSDEDLTTTPIPSLHGNLVRNRTRADPLRFYEPLEPLGEGSMGSVSKVRKRTEFIGGSARAEYVKSHHSHSKVMDVFPFYFCPMKRTFSDEYYRSTPPGSSAGESSLPESPLQKCFFMFCCPAKKQVSAILDPISEDTESAVSTDIDNQQLLQGCWGGVFGNAAKKKQTRQADSFSEKGGEDSSERTDNVLKKEDYEAIERQLDRALKRSASSMITYGHKDIVYALKSIHLDRVSNSDFMKELKNEVFILKQLDHPNIVKCFETFHYNSSLYLVLEICSGSDLYSRDPYSEQEACRIIRSVLSAVAYMHSKQITHRDLKYENIMFVNSEPDAEVKIIDFGLSKKYAADTYLHDTVGTVYTMAPELLKGGYTEVVDVWSLGVISFMLLSSSMPFFGKDRKQVIKKIIKGHYQFISRRWKTVSTDAKAFVVKLLQHNPNNRPSAADALADAWFTRSDFDYQGFAKEVAVMDQVQATIQAFADYGKLKKLALMLIAYKMTSAEIGYLRKMWERFDLRQDGEVTLEEFKGVLADYEYSNEELERMFYAMDLDGTGLVHYSEFLASCVEAIGSINEEQVAECFDTLDNDDNGYITKDDIKNFLGRDIPQSYIDAIMKEADLNNDKKISYAEFLAMWDEKADDKMRKDREDVKQRRHRRADSNMSSMSETFSSDFSDDEFDELAVKPVFSFESGEIEKMLEAPDTPVAGEKRITPVNAFLLEKDRSVRSNRKSLTGAGDLLLPNMDEAAKNTPKGNH